MPRLLTNIVLSEVSLVDEPANRRKFVIIKSTDGDLPGKAAELLKALTESDAPDRFVKSFTAMDADSQAGLVSLLETADGYSEVMPDVLAQTIAKLAEAVVGEDGVAVAKATAQKIAEMKKKGNRLLKQLEDLVEEAKTADGGKRQYADAIKSLDEFVGSLQWLINSGLVEGEGPQAYVPTGVGEELPLGKSGRILSGDNLKKLQTFLTAFNALGGTVDDLNELVASASVEKAEGDTTEGAAEVTEETVVDTNVQPGTEATPPVVPGSTDGEQVVTPVVVEPKPEVPPVVTPTPTPETVTPPAPVVGSITLPLAEYDAKIEAAKVEGAKAGAEAAMAAMRDEIGT